MVMQKNAPVIVPLSEVQSRFCYGANTGHTACPFLQCGEVSKVFPGEDRQPFYCSLIGERLAALKAGRLLPDDWVGQRLESVVGIDPEVCLDLHDVVSLTETLQYDSEMLQMHYKKGDVRMFLSIMQRLRMPPDNVFNIEVVPINRLVKITSGSVNNS